ncbi:hypothetical protein CBR_g51235 [Chara braunii]|uniref:TraB domain-containing protein n=1 Tax=Chara braunii TaxID=69332 RepID=A0A388M811_CHABU|nr:hypothetical protein CBR_g51235 [Chara braunii]|eukprot:GBG90727.1 hypothetical protein CBR_g51235 [Chara braunii]
MESSKDGSVEEEEGREQKQEQEERGQEEESGAVDGNEAGDGDKGINDGGGERGVGEETPLGDGGERTLPPLSEERDGSLSRRSATSALGKRSSGDVGSEVDGDEDLTERSPQRLRISDDDVAKANKEDQDGRLMELGAEVFVDRGAMNGDIMGAERMMGGGGIWDQAPGHHPAPGALLVQQQQQLDKQREEEQVMEKEEEEDEEGGDGNDPYEPRRGSPSPEGMVGGGGGGGEGGGDGGSQRGITRELLPERGPDGAIILPPSLDEAVTVLECEQESGEGKAFVYVLGTAHVSQESCKDVRLLIRLVRPDVVFVEVCRDRMSLFTLAPKLPVPTFLDVVQQLRAKNANTFAILYSSLLAKIASKMDIVPGAEFRAAYEEAKDLQAVLELGDRPVKITLQRTWGRMSRWQKIKLIWTLIYDSFRLPDAEALSALIESLKDSDVLVLAIRELGEAFPILTETLIHERDQYMAATLQECAKQARAVVAVVGKGHQKGIAENWGKPIDIQSLMTVPLEKPKSSWLCFSSVGLMVLSVAIGGAAVYMGSKYLRGST